MENVPRRPLWEDDSDIYSPRSAPSAPDDLAREIALRICEEIMFERWQRGWTQAELARRAGVSERTVRDVESRLLKNRSGKPHSSTLRKLAEALGIERDDWWLL